VIEIHKQAVSVQEPQKIVSNPYERMPLAETTQPVILLRKPIFPKFVIPTDKYSGRFRSIRRELGYIFALGLVTWLAVLFAAFTAVVARSQELFPSSNVQIFYDESAIAVVNFSNTSIDLSNITFQRLSDRGTVVATFSAEQWGRVNPETLKALPAGDCVQLLRPGFNNFSITPGTAPAKPSSCDVSQGWLVAFDDGWLFWVPGGDGALFQVVQNGQIVRTCRIADGSCEFFLPGQE
jgi:hypothetical protein